MALLLFVLVVVFRCMSSLGILVSNAVVSGVEPCIMCLSFYRVKLGAVELILFSLDISVIMSLGWLMVASICVIVFRLMFEVFDVRMWWQKSCWYSGVNEWVWLISFWFVSLVRFGWWVIRWLILFWLARSLGRLSRENRLVR